MPTRPIILDISGVANDDGKEAVATAGLALWTESECSTLPPVSTWDGSGDRPAGEHWTVRVGTHADLEQLGNQGSCGVTDGEARTIYVFQGRLASSCYISNETFDTVAERDRQSQVQTAGHEFGHVLRLGDANSGACLAPQNGKPSIMSAANGNRTAVTPADCAALEKEVDRFCDENPDADQCGDGGGGDPDVDCAGGGCRPGRGDDDDETDACALPTPGCPGYCDLNPFHRECPPDCKLFPGDPRCGDVTYEVCWGRYEDTDGDGELECVPAAYLRIGGDGKNPVVVTAAAAASRSYRIRLDHAGKLGVKLTGMNRDFDCKLYESGEPPSSDAPDAATVSTSTWNCTNRGGARDDSLERSLPAGAHTLSVYPFTGGTGDYTLTLTYAADPLPSPIARILPFTSEVTTASSSTFRFTVTESAKVSVLISEMTADFDCRVEPGSKCSNNRGTLDDTWSGTLAPATHSLTVYPHGGASGLFKLAVYRTGETPPSHDTGTDEGEDEDDDADTEDDDEEEDTGGGGEDDGDTGDGEGEGEDTDTGEEEDGDSDDGEDEDDEEPEPDPPPTPAARPPGVPTVTGSVVRQTQMVSWTEPATNGAAVTRYQMAVRNSAAHSWRWTTAGSPSGSSNFGPTVRSWSVTTPAGLLRHYRVRATNSAGDGAWSAHVELRSETPTPPPPPPPPPPPAAKPGAPTLTGSLASTQTHSLSWTAAPSTIPITGYQMQTRNSSRHGWRFTTAGSPSPSNSFGPTVQSWRVTTPPGLHRQYRVRGRNASGYGSWSNVVSLTSGGDSLRGPGPPGGLVGADDGDDNGDGQTDGCSDPSDPTVDDTLPSC